MKALLLCHFQPAAMAHVPAEARAAMMHSMMDYNQQRIQAGALSAAGITTTHMVMGCGAAAGAVGSVAALNVPVSISRSAHATRLNETPAHTR